MPTLTLAQASLIVDQALPCDDVETGWRKTLGLLGSRIKHLKIQPSDQIDREMLGEPGVGLPPGGESRLQPSRAFFGQPHQAVLPLLWLRKKR